MGIETDNKPSIFININSKTPPKVAAVIDAASKNTGVNFNYLMAQAHKESGFEAKAVSRNSSASGLFQFTKSTWLELIKKHGAQHGLADMAEQIHAGTDGSFTVATAGLKKEILDLRRDPEIAAMMAGEYANDNKKLLEKSLGRSVNSTDLYLAHFLGPNGATLMLKAHAANPNQPAADILPAAALKNDSIFFSEDHSPRTVTALYTKIHHAIEGGGHKFKEPPPYPDTKIASAVEEKQPSQDDPDTWKTVASSITKENNAHNFDKIIAMVEKQESADQISSAMPPINGRVVQYGKSLHPVANLIKNLFG